MSTSRTTATQILARLAIQQWANDRAAVRVGKVARYGSIGWRERRLCDADARIVRSLDFERQLSTLQENEQMILVLAYRDRQPQAVIAQTLNCSPRAIAYQLPKALDHLANALDRAGIL